MIDHTRPMAVRIACTLLLGAFVAACGGSDNAAVPVPPPVAVTPVATTLDLLSSTARAMDTVVFLGDSAYLSLANSATEGSAVLRTALPLTAASTWRPVDLGACAMAPVGDFIRRSPKIKLVGQDVWLMQPWADTPATSDEHSTCSLSQLRSASRRATRICAPATTTSARRCRCRT